MLKEVSEDIEDASVREYRGEAFGEGGHKTLSYLIPTFGRDDIIAGLDREIQKRERGPTSTVNIRSHQLRIEFSTEDK